MSDIKDSVADILPLFYLWFSLESLAKINDANIKLLLLPNSAAPKLHDSQAIATLTLLLLHQITQNIDHLICAGRPSLSTGVHLF